MIKGAFRFFGRVMRQPSYVVNAIRFVQLAIKLKINKRWPSPNISVPRDQPFKKLLIVMRTSDAVQHCSVPRGLEEFGIFDKRDIIRVCGRSFVEAVRTFRRRNNGVELRVVLVEDRLSAEGRAVYQEAGPIEEVISSAGNRETFMTQIDVALKADDETLICVLEDDYLLNPEVFCEAFELFNTTSITGFTPHFHPALVNGETKVRLICVKGRFYAQVLTTTCTFFILARDVRRNLSRLRRYYGCELGNINEIWHDGVCLAPCCRTLAEHMHRHDLSYSFSGVP